MGWLTADIQKSQSAITDPDTDTRYRLSASRFQIAVTMLGQGGSHKCQEHEYQPTAEQHPHSDSPHSLTEVGDPQEKTRTTKNQKQERYKTSLGL